jgi:Tfp pilus assembly protein PilF
MIQTPLRAGMAAVIVSATCATSPGVKADDAGTRNLLEKGTSEMADATEAIRLDPRYFRGYQTRGRIYSNRRQFEQAERDYETALRLNPRFAQLYNNRGDLVGTHRRAGLVRLAFFERHE